MSIPIERYGGDEIWLQAQIQVSVYSVTTRDNTKPATNFEDLSSKDQETVASFLEKLSINKTKSTNETTNDNVSLKNSEILNLPPFDYKINEDQSFMTWGARERGIQYFSLLIFDDMQYEPDFEEFVISISPAQKLNTFFTKI